MSKFAQRTINWSDLQFALAVMRRGTIAGAAADLGVNRSTVLRRIASLETWLDFQIFEREGNRYVLAPGAGPLLDGASQVERTIDDLHRQIQGKNIQLEGTITLTTTDSILESILAPHLSTFRDRHPKILIELLVSNRQLSLRRRDADVAVRPGLKIPDHLHGRLIGPMRFALYAQPGLVTEESLLRNVPLLGMESPLVESPPGRWFNQHIDDSQVVGRADSFVALRSLAQAGLGVALLPTALGKRASDLEQVFINQPIVENKLWVVTHPDLLRSNRVNALIEHLCAEMKTDAA